MTQAAKDAYEALLSKIELQDPHCGWVHERQLPRLTPEQEAVVLSAYPSLLMDVVPHFEGMVEIVRTNGENPLMVQMVMSTMITPLKRMFREMLLQDLQKRRDEREEIQNDPYTLIEWEAESKLEADRSDGVI